MRRIVNFLLEEFFFVGHLQSLGAVSITIISTFLLGADFAWQLMLVPYLLLQPIYYFDYSLGMKIDEPTNRARVAHLRQYIRFLPVIIAFFIVFALSILFQLGSQAAIIFSLLVLVGGLVYPMVKRITRYVPLFKNIYVASVFAAFVFFPATFTTQLTVQQDTTISLAVFVFLEALLMQFVLDIKDKESDEAEKLLTFPTLIGRRKTFGIVLVLALFVFGLAYFASPSHFLAKLGLVSLAVNSVALWLVSRRIRWGYLVAALKFLLWLVLPVIEIYVV